MASDVVRASPLLEGASGPGHGCEREAMMGVRCSAGLEVVA